MNGRGISFSYLEDGKLEKAEADNGSSLTYNYNKEDNIEKKHARKIRERRMQNEQ